MRVLWITNILFPAASEALGLPDTVFGGWMTSSLNALREISPESSFAVATVYKGRELRVIEKDSVVYFLLPSQRNNTKYDKSLEPIWQKVKKDFKPDLVHIHGTEYAHGLAYIRACGSDNVCLSIQGLVSVIARYYYAGMTIKDIIRNVTIRDILRWDTIFQQKWKFEKRGELEKEYIKTVQNIIGRTSWDRTHIWAINPDAKYHFCNEILRPSFYNHKWEYDKCEKHTIFLSQASYPIKGLHKLLEAMPLILRHFPDARIKVAGESIVDKPFYRISGYGRYLRSLMKRLHLEDKVIFLGTLSEEQMCEQYLKANVFICPSSIENSPNSLGEAQILGVPHIAANVGGVMDMMDGNEKFLYRFDEIEMAAYKICGVFTESDDAPQMIRAVEERHEKIKNVHLMTEIYTKIYEDYL